MTFTQLLVFGSINYDELMSFDGLFKDHLDSTKPEGINVFFVALELDRQLGGIATNVAYSFANLSDKKCSLLGGVGYDKDQLVEFFEQSKIDTQHLQVSDTTVTGTYKGITDTDKNQIGMFFIGANEQAYDIDLKNISDLQDSLLIIAANAPKSFLHMQKQAIELGVKYMYDPGMTLSWITSEDLREGIVNAEFVIMNQHEKDVIEKKLNIDWQEILDKGTKLIVTLGNKGATYKDATQAIQCSAYLVEKVADPTGAGDSFRGGFCAGLLAGLDISECLKQGAAVASCCVETVGAVNYTIDRNEIEKRMKVITIH